jgi:hypothetical protein
MTEFSKCAQTLKKLENGAYAAIFRCTKNLKQIKNF